MNAKTQKCRGEYLQYKELTDIDGTVIYLFKSAIKIPYLFSESQYIWTSFYDNILERVPPWVAPYGYQISTIEF